MEDLENKQNMVNTIRSKAGDWSGLPVLFDDTPNDHLSFPNKVTIDTNDLTDRWINLADCGYTPGTPAAGAVKVFDIVTAVLRNNTLWPLISHYAGVSWDSISVRVTVSDPKAIAGGFHIGWYPFRDWFATQSLGTWNFEAVEEARHAVNKMTIQRLLLAPECQLVTFSQAGDVEFDIPWQYPWAFYRTYLLSRDASHPTNYPQVGSPILFMNGAAANFVSSVQYGNRVQIFVKFNGLKQHFPEGLYMDADARNARELEPQSGLEAVAVTALVETAAVAATEIVSSVAGTQPDEATYETDYGSYGQPTSVQLSFAGDTTCVGPPGVAPIFSKKMFDSSSHKLISYLSRPQFIGVYPCDNTLRRFWANPTVPDEAAWGTPSSPCCTYFNWFSQCAQYWRGTLCFDIVIMGHPMVELGYDLQVSPPGGQFMNAMGTMGNNVMLKGICNGVKRIRVPMPFFSHTEWLPIVDGAYLSLDKKRWLSSSMLKVSIQVLSTMLDVVPVIHYGVYMSAMPDFEFSFPYPAGMYNVDQGMLRPEDGEAYREKPRIMVGQVGIPCEPEIFETRAVPVEPSTTMLPLINVEDYFKFWSRALPYSTVDTNDEPVIDSKMMGMVGYISPGESASWTPDVNNSWYVCQDYLALFSSQFLLYRGSIGIKVICSGIDVAGDYKYIALGNHAERQVVHNPFTVVSDYVPIDSNFGMGCVITPSDKQPTLEVVLPYRSLYPWDYVQGAIDYRTFDNEFGEKLEFVNTNVSLHTPGADLRDSLFRKAGEDFHLAVECLLPPAPLWMARGYDWS